MKPGPAFGTFLRGKSLKIAARVTLLARLSNFFGCLTMWLMIVGRESTFIDYHRPSDQAFIINETDRCVQTQTENVSLFRVIAESHILGLVSEFLIWICFFIRGSNCPQIEHTN